MNAFTGTWQLCKLALRLDRIKLPVWILTNVGLVALTLPQLITAYDTAEKRLAYAAATSSSAVTRLLSGALTGPSIGEITVVETFMLVALVTALMNIFLVSRHTRLNEQSGRSELIESLAIGRYASLTAALSLALIANIVTSGLFFLLFFLNDYPFAGSLSFSLVTGFTGMFFASVSALTVQLFDNTRSANGMAGLVFGVFFIIRGIGDAFGNLKPGGIGVETNFLSYFSPLGWFTNIRSFAGEQWWILWLFSGLTTVLIGASFMLLKHRDIGSSIVAQRPGRVFATPWLLGRFGLAWRLNRVGFMAWLASITVMGITIGAVAVEFEELISGNDEMKELLASLGGGASVTDVMFNAMFAIAGIAIAGYTLQLLTRLRTEEAAGRVELMLATPLSRIQWLFNHTLFVATTAVVIVIAMGLAAGISYGLITSNVTQEAARLSVAMLVQLPAIFVVVGVGIMFFALLPKWSKALSWAMLAIYVLLFQLGNLLKLPQWLMNTSPFSHTPPALTEAFNPIPLVILASVAFVLLSGALLFFRRRDIPVV